jgi:hypothetical protein
LTLKDGENAELKSQLNEQQARSEELANRIRAEQASRDRVENRLKEIETLLGHQEVEKTANARRRFLINWSAVLVVLVATSALAVKLLKPAPGFWPTVLFAWSAIVFVWTWLADRFASTNEQVREWRPASLLHSFRREIFSLLAFVIGWRLIEIAGGTAWDWLKTAFQPK